jgi:hypothetical protein
MPLTPTILAQDFPGELIGLGVLLVLGLLGHIARKIKERQEAREAEERARQQEVKRPPSPQQRGRQQPRPQPGRESMSPAEEAVRALREVIAGSAEPAEPPPPPQTRRQPPRQRRKQRREQTAAPARPAPRPKPAELVELEAAPPDLYDQHYEEVSERRVIVDLSDRKEALRGIIYAEILGPPKALRSGPEPWER